jgi:protein-L-isoaspartate O-methyltransferase
MIWNTSSKKKTLTTAIIDLCVQNGFILLKHAAALEILKDHLRDGDRALDVGSGSGYLTACMAEMVCVIITDLMVVSY